MNNSPVENWFALLKDIWSTKDTSRVKELLSSEFKYYEDPFENPLTTVSDVEEAWQEINNQDIQLLDIKPLLVKENRGTATYHLLYNDPQGVTQESRGTYYVELDSEGKAVEFRQWWVRK